MKRSRKILVAVLLAVVLLAGSISGIALAADGEEDGSLGDRIGDLFEKTGQIYQDKTGTSLDADILQESFQEASEELMIRIGPRFHHWMSDECYLTDEQLEELENWLESKPDVLTDEFKDWMESKPEGLPFGGGMHGPSRHFLGFKRFDGGIHGWCLPEAPAE